MRPVFHKPLARQRFALRNLVMREDKISAAAVQIYLIAERRAVHRRTFDMPAGASFAPRRIPGNFALFRRLPQREIVGVFFLFVVFHAHAVQRVFEVPPG